MRLKKVFITKYALTSGIIECDAEIRKDNSCFANPTGWDYGNHFHGNDFHLTLEDAKKDAEFRKVKKIKSLQKQIQKLQNISFN